MTSEDTQTVAVQRHVITTEVPFTEVLDGIYAEVSKPDMQELFPKIFVAKTYEELTAVVDEAQGSSGLMLFLQLDMDVILSKDPQAQHMAGRRLARLIAGNPVTMGTMARNVSAVGSYVPATVLVEELEDGGTRVSYDTVSSEIAPYENAAASEIANDLDASVLGVLRRATRVPALNNA